MAALDQRRRRERLARKEAERLLEDKSRQLYEAHQALQHTLADTERRVEERTEELSRANQRLRAEIEFRRDAEASLRTALDAAEAASQAKMLFLANMSHEIRTPLNGVIGMVELLGTTALDDQQGGYVETVRESAEALMVILNDILDLAKIEGGKLALEATAFDAALLTRQVGELFAGMADDRGLELRVRVDPDTPAFLLGDPVRVRQVLTNLVGNALKFTERGHVDLELAARACPGDRCELTFRVADTGVGIPPDKLATIFDAFTQADESTTRRFGGTGLGLSICRQLVHLMGGLLDVHSQPDLGSTFEVRLPLPVSSEGPSRHRPGAPRPFDADQPVLLVEDNPVNQLVARGMLSRLGLEVVLAENGREALEQLAERRFALVLMDCQMPELDGYAATRALRAGEHGVLDPDVTVVAMTAHAMAGDAARCTAAGMDGYVAKPVTLGSLRGALEQHLPRA